MTPLTIITQLFDYLQYTATDTDVTFKSKYAGQTCDLARKAINNQSLPLKAELISGWEFRVTITK